MRDILLKILLFAPPVLFSIVLHEVMHGYVADKLGDGTARRAGRLTLNPVKHIDPVGTIILPLALLIISRGGMVFGWAKPVPINPLNTLNPKRTMGLTALAGPMTNLVLAILCTLALALLPHSPGMLPSGGILTPISIMLQGGLVINVVLTVFNLIPVPPLDGGRVLVWLLPDDMAKSVAKIEPYGMFIIFGLLILNPGNILSKLIGGVLTLFVRFI